MKMNNLHAPWASHKVDGISNCIVKKLDRDSANVALLKGFGGERAKVASTVKLAVSILGRRK